MNKNRRYWIIVGGVLAVLNMACQKSTGPDEATPQPVWYPYTHHQLMQAARETLEVLIVRHNITLLPTLSEYERVDSARKLLVTALQPRIVNWNQFQAGLRAAEQMSNYWFDIIPDTLRRVFSASGDLYMRVYGDSLLRLIDLGPPDSIFALTTQRWLNAIKAYAPNAPVLKILESAKSAYTYWHDYNTVWFWGRAIYVIRQGQGLLNIGTILQHLINELRVWRFLVCAEIQMAQHNNGTDYLAGAVLYTVIYLFQNTSQ
jgi:hypothetical protein